VWLYALRHVDVSYAYPFIALGFVFTLLIGHYFLQENVNVFRITGVFLISAGIFLVARS
jgi:drug/metabolite transporter (DMT)-like permease